MTSPNQSTRATIFASQSGGNQGTTMSWLSTAQSSRSSTETSDRTNPAAVTNPFIRKLRRSFTRKTPQKFNRSSEYWKQRATTVVSTSNSVTSSRSSSQSSSSRNIGSSKSNVYISSSYNAVTIGYNTTSYNSVSSIRRESTSTNSGSTVSIANNRVGSNSSSTNSGTVNGCTDNCDNKTSDDGINAHTTVSSINSISANPNSSDSSSVSISAQTTEYASVTNSMNAVAVSAQRSVSNDASRHQTQTVWSKSSYNASTTSAFPDSSKSLSPQLWRQRTSRDSVRSSVHDTTNTVVQTSSIDLTTTHISSSDGNASQEAITDPTTKRSHSQLKAEHLPSSSPLVVLVDETRTYLTSTGETEAPSLYQKTLLHQPDVKQTRKIAQVLNDTFTIADVTLVAEESTESSNETSPERPSAGCCPRFNSTLSGAGVQRLDTTTLSTVGLPETVYLDEVPPSNDLVGRAATGSVSGEIVAVSIGCILVFWIILGPVAYAIYRSKENAKKTRRVKDKNASAAAVLEEIIRVELAKGRSRLYRTAVGDERELERLSLDDYGPANWQHHIELPSSHSLLRAACLDSPSSRPPFDSLPFNGILANHQSHPAEIPVRSSYDAATRTPEANRKAYEGFSYNGAFVMGTEPRSRRYSTATRLPAMGSSASLQRRALHNLSSPTGETGSGPRVTTSASVNHLALLRQGPLEPHVIGKPTSPEGGPLFSNQLPNRMVVSPTSGHFPDKPRFPIMGQASLVHGTGSHKVLISHDRGCNSDALHRRTTTQRNNRVIGGLTLGGSFGSPTKEEEVVWMYHPIQNLTKTSRKEEEHDCLRELEDSAV